jgi:hypothetical protein
VERLICHRFVHKRRLILVRDDGHGSWLDGDFLLVIGGLFRLLLSCNFRPAILFLLLLLAFFDLNLHLNLGLVFRAVHDFTGTLPRLGPAPAKTLAPLPGLQPQRLGQRHSLEVGSHNFGQFFIEVHI